MKNWTISRRIAAGFTGVITITIALGGFAYRGMVLSGKEANLIVRESLPRVQAACDMRAFVTDNFARTMQHILSKPEQKPKIRALMKETSAKLNEIYAGYEKGIASDEDRQLYARVKDARAKYVGIRDKKVLAFSGEGKVEEAAQVLEAELHAAHLEYFSALQSLVDYNSRVGQNAGSVILKASSNGQRGMLFGGAAAVLLAASISWLLARGIRRNLSSVALTLGQSSDQVALASMQVSSSSQSLAEGASEQAASLEETSASLEEMASMTRRNAENAQSAKELANQARLAADTGASDMAQMDGAMAEIKQASDNIAKIIKTIDEIAFQTNILALNAAVEAARAGEAGMGFAVVADEVRSLAQRSAQAAKETAEKIEDCIRKSEAGVEISTKVAGSLQEILSKATQVDELVAEIATASREQSQGIDQVNTALTQMDKVTQSNAASAEESASAAEELSGQAQALKGAVGDLLFLVEGSDQAPELASPAEIRTATIPKEGPHVTKDHALKKSPLPKKKKSIAPDIMLRTADGESVIPLEDEFRDF